MITLTNVIDDGTFASFNFISMRIDLRISPRSGEPFVFYSFCTDYKLRLSTTRVLLHRRSDKTSDQPNARTDSVRTVNGRGARSESPRIRNLGERINVRVKLIRPFVESTGARSSATRLATDGQQGVGQRDEKKKEEEERRKTTKKSRRELLDIDGNIR